MSNALEVVRRADGRLMLFGGDVLLGYVALANGNAAARKAPKAPMRRKAGKATRSSAKSSGNGATGERGKNTGILRRCETCSAKTRRTICPNGHRVADDPE